MTVFQGGSRSDSAQTIRELIEQYGGVGGAVYVHSQSSPSQSWIVNHNLGVQPTVQVFTLGGVVVQVEIFHVSLNQCMVNAAQPFSGYARCGA